MMRYTLASFFFKKNIGSAFVCALILNVIIASNPVIAADSKNTDCDAKSFDTKLLDLSAVTVMHAPQGDSDYAVEKNGSLLYRGNDAHQCQVIAYVRKHPRHDFLWLGENGPGLVTGGQGYPIKIQYLVNRYFEMATKYQSISNEEIGLKRKLSRVMSYHIRGGIDSSTDSDSKKEYSSVTNEYGGYANAVSVFNKNLKNLEKNRLELASQQLSVVRDLDQQVALFASNSKPDAFSDI